MTKSKVPEVAPGEARGRDVADKQEDDDDKDEPRITWNESALKGKGWGVRPLADVPKGTFIATMIGRQVKSS
jgi:hypothetical protein